MGPYLKSRNFSSAWPFTGLRADVLSRAECSPACAPRGRLSGEQPARPAARWEALATGAISARSFR